MARSVSSPTDAQVIAYQTFQGQDECDWDDFKEDIVESCKYRWPSLDDCDEWLDREDHAILENRLVYIGISEYCGMVAIWIVPKEPEESYWGYSPLDTTPLAYHWIDQIKDQFLKMFAEHVKHGSMSNGAGVFYPVDGLNKGEAPLISAELGCMFKPW